MAWKDYGWGTWSHRWGAEEWKGSDWDWAGEKKGAKKEKPNWKEPGGKDVTTLGLKHAMPLEDRRELVLGLVNGLRDDVESTHGAPFQVGSVGVGARIAPRCLVPSLQGAASNEGRSIAE